MQNKKKLLLDEWGEKNEIIEKEKDINIWEKMIFFMKNIEKWKKITIGFCA